MTSSIFKVCTLNMLPNYDQTYYSSLKTDYKIYKTEFTPLEIVNAFVELINFKYVEDAIYASLNIISLEINPSTISHLTFESIDDDNFIIMI